MIFAYLYSVITVKCNYPLHIRKFKKAWYFPIRFFLFHFFLPKQKKRFLILFQSVAVDKTK